MIVKELVILGLLMLVIDFVYLSSVGNYLILKLNQFKVRFKNGYLGGIICYPF